MKNPFEETGDPAEEALKTHELEKAVHEHEPKRSLSLNPVFNIRYPTENGLFRIRQERRPKDAEICACGAWRWVDEEEWSESAFPSPAEIGAKARRDAKAAEVESA